MDSKFNNSLIKIPLNKNPHVNNYIKCGDFILLITNMDKLIKLNG